LGEGAAILVLEEREHALSRNVRIYGEILGYGMAADAYDLTDIPPQDAPGMTLCLQKALSTTGIDPCAVGYINVHGTATKMNDLAEASAIKQVFGEHATVLPVSGIKGSLGHGLGAAGALEAVTALLSSCCDLIPPTYGLVDPDPGCDLCHVIGKGMRASVPVALSTGVGMGGNNSAIVLRGEKCSLDGTDFLNEEGS